MPNFRVRDLDAMLAQLRSAGADVEDKVEDYDYGRFGWVRDVEDKVEDYEYGRFGWVRDPEGNRIELWEPSADGLEPPA